MRESSAAIRAPVRAARNIQLAQFSKIESSNMVANADIRVGEIRQFLQAAKRRSEFDAGRDIVPCMNQLNLSARVYHRILKLACTIANLAGSEKIQSTYWVERAYHLKSRLGQ